MTHALPDKTKIEELLAKLSEIAIIDDPVAEIVTIDGNDYTIKYPVGSFVYSLQKAKKGIVHYLVLKKYDLKINAATYDQPIVLYTDTLNWLWNEDELCTQTQAITIATDYLQSLIAEINELES